MKFFPQMVWESWFENEYQVDWNLKYVFHLQIGFWSWVWFDFVDTTTVLDVWLLSPYLVVGLDASFWLTGLLGKVHHFVVG